MPVKVLLRKASTKLLRFFKTRVKEYDYFNNANYDNIHFIVEHFDEYSSLFPKVNDIVLAKINIIKRCDSILSHQFDLLGSGLKCVNINNKKNQDNFDLLHSSIFKYQIAYNCINWQLDFKSGYEWDAQKESFSLTYGDKDGVDVKVPWELGRMQHLPLLAYASVISEVYKKYFNEYCNEIIDFIANNPVGFGIQWKSSMDVSIRAVNFILSYVFLKINQVHFPPDFERIFAKSIYQHLLFIFRNPERNDGLRGNHYFFNLVGMIVVNKFIASDLTENIGNYSQDNYINELNNQFNADGSNFEGSIHYHLFTSEAVFLIDKFLPKQVKDNSYIDKISRIKAFCRANLNDNWESSRFGDDDGGYLVKLKIDSLLSLNNYSYLTEYIESGFESTKNMSYPDFGLYIANKHNYRIYFRCGSVGQNGKGGHCHNDQLSLVLMIKNKFVFTDPGTFCYTSDSIKRNLFRSTENHNVLYLKGIEQNYLSNDIKDLFWMPDKSRAKMIGFDENYIAGEHTGFGIPCRRSINSHDSYFEITDELKVDSEKYINFNVHPDFEVETDGKKVIIKDSNIIVELISDAEMLSIRDYNYSPAYGYISPAKRIILNSFNKRITTKVNITLI